MSDDQNPTDAPKVSEPSEVGDTVRSTASEVAGGGKKKGGKQPGAGRPFGSGKAAIRDEKGRIVKGSASIGPNGRPKSLRARLAAETSDGELMVNGFVAIATGKLRATARDRMDALKWLSDRYWGKTPEVAMVGRLDEDSASAMRELTREQLMDLITRTPQQALPAPREVEVIDVTPTVEPAEPGKAD